MSELRTDGPHSPETTKAAADQVAELIRYLNYATMDGSGGLRYPSDAYELLALLWTATGRLPQLLRQLVTFLRAQHDSGRLGDDSGQDPGECTGVACGALLTAMDHADALTRALQAAQNAIAGLHVFQDGTDG